MRGVAFVGAEAFYLLEECYTFFGSQTASLE